jgi:aspartate ammonia-lyase
MNAHEVIANKTLETGKSLKDIVIDKERVDKDNLEEILSVENLMHPKFFRE